MGEASCAPKCLVLSNLLLSFLVFMPSFTHSASTALKKVIITCRYSQCDHDFNCSWKLPEKINGTDVKVLVQQRNNNVFLKWKPCDGCNVTTQRNNVLAEQGFIHIKLSYTSRYGYEYLVSVTVQDDDGNATTSIITSMKDVQPNSPTDVIVSPVMDKDTYLSVRWNNSSTNCLLYLMYKLRYKQDQNEWEEIQIETDDEPSSCNIVDAQPGKKHLVQVAAKDFMEGSWSEWSSVAYGWPWSPVEVTTTEVVPRCQMHVTASHLMGKENGLKVQWDVTQTCPRPLVYRLWYRQYDQIEWKKYKTKDSFFNIMDIRPGVKYLVQVAAMGIDHKILSNWTSVTYEHSSSSTTAGGTIPWMVILIAIVVTLVSILTLLAVWHKWLRHEYSAITRKCSA
uniref:ciliary neurotrophic factor receptor subunit alpha-like n=1 Tax=Myxine glutinosa TaxID=7769 RepID=UPI0035900066